MESNTTFSSRLCKILAGLILVGVGTILLLHQLGYLFPEWVISWPMLLIVLGFVSGTLHRFRNPSWILLVAIGAIFLLDSLYPTVNIIRFIWPVASIATGLWVIFGKHRAWKHKKWERYQQWAQQNYEAPIHNMHTSHFHKDDLLDAVSVFGGIKKNILSKDFKGGEVVTFMGGVELNLTNADIHGHVTLEVVQVLGGTKIIIPSHWEVISEMVAVLGGIEDKRVQIPGTSLSPDKVLVIKGTSVLAGIEIHSYV